MRHWVTVGVDLVDPVDDDRFNPAILDEATRLINHRHFDMLSDLHLQHVAYHDPGGARLLVREREQACAAARARSAPSPSGGTGADDE
jgi:hypothetical protein